MKNPLQKSIQLLELFKNLDQDMSVSCALTILYAAGEDTQRDLETRLGLSNAAASRNVAYWTEFRRYQVAGMNFLDQFPDPQDRRYRRIELKPKGTAFIKQVAAITGE